MTQLVNQESQLMEAESYDSLWRHAQRISKTDYIPKSLQGKPENILMILQMGAELGLGPMQSLSEIGVINNRPSLSAKLSIGRANQSGIFEGRIWFEQQGETYEDLRVFALAKLKWNEEIVKAEASIKMAMAEGWTRNPKYKSMPIQMLSYRAAVFLIRKYAPEVLIGVPIIDIEAQDLGPQSQRNETVDQLNAALKQDIEGAE